ncbi:MAG: M20/M25/M40 family metallo-hydrolase, partial [Phycisphaerales bacterium]|nr:M20/M25/M40 family metallo-hydrolase [Phycisphaerales bacterium]
MRNVHTRRLGVHRLIMLVTMATGASAAVAGPIADAYRSQADRIIDAALTSDDAYTKLQHLCDDIGHRICGSEALDRAIEWASAELRKDGMSNVHTEPVEVIRWVRGNESCEMVAPRRQPLVMLALGKSVGTPPDGITAPVVVVADEDELEKLGDGAKGKIVLFNNPMPPYDSEKGSGYGHTVRFRTNGARLAAEKGAVACLVRSVTAHSLRTPHTGTMNYKDAPVQIPAAAVTVEDAETIDRMTKRGIEVVLNIKMDAKNHGPAMSANVVGELRGSTHPEQIVVIGGHIDSWDVGQGAHDDGGGCIMALASVKLLKDLGLQPKRTIRVVLWTGEEIGLFGGKQYAKDHADELANHVAAMESDSGAFAPKGYGVDCKDESRMKAAADQLRDIMTLMEKIGATDVSEGHGAPDVSPLQPEGVIVMGHEVEGSKYFDYHHTPADTMDKVNPLELKQNVAMMATMA